MDFNKLCSPKTKQQLEKYNKCVEQLDQVRKVYKTRNLSSIVENLGNFKYPYLHEKSSDCNKTYIFRISVTTATF